MAMLEQFTAACNRTTAILAVSDTGTLPVKHFDFAQCPEPAEGHVKDTAGSAAQTHTSCSAQSNCKSRAGLASGGSA